MRLVGHFDFRMPGPARSAIDQHGSSTSQPFSASLRANWLAVGMHAARPHICSGVWSASGSATTWASKGRFGRSIRPSPHTPSSTGQRTCSTLYDAVSATSAGFWSSPHRSRRNDPVLPNVIQKCAEHLLGTFVDYVRYLHTPSTPFSGIRDDLHQIGK
jgi:hypothetical protein